MRLALMILAGASLASAADSPLADASRKDDRLGVRALLDRHADPNAPQVDGTTALHWSVRQDDLDMSRLLLKAGKPVQVGARALEILILLAERRGDVVSKEELIAHAWPDVAVEEGGLRVHIAGLRKALGDGKDGARFC